MRRRLTAWITLLMLVMSVALPAHARMAIAAVGMGDLCVAGASGKAAPAAPAQHHETTCDACCGCAGADALPRAASAISFPPRDASCVASHVDGGTKASLLRFSLARGPPRVS